MTMLKEASSFASDVTFSKPFHQQKSHLGKQESSLSSNISSETVETEKKSVQKHVKLRKFGLFAKGLLLKYWFLLGLVIVILLAYGFPNVARRRGYIRAEWSIKWGAVIVIFLISGLSLRTRILAQTIIRVRLHLLIQVINLVMIPFFVFGLVLLFFKLRMPVNSLLLIGVVIAASTPTTVSSNVVMTKNAHGNEASALMNAALGNVLGIFVSPALVSVFQGPLIAASPEDESANTAGGAVDFVSVLKQLGLTVLLPLVVGQIIQIMYTEPVAKFKVKFRLSDVSSFCLLLLVWSVFSDAVFAGSFAAVAGKDIAAVIILNFFFYILFSGTCFFLARLPYPRSVVGRLKWLERLQYDREDTVAVMFCGATKTVAMGVPLINVLYQKGDPGTIGVLSTPLLLYHVEQLILGNIEVEILKKWVARGKAQKEQQSLAQDEETASVDDPDTNTSDHTTAIPNSVAIASVPSAATIPVAAVKDQPRKVDNDSTTKDYLSPTAHSTLRSTTANTTTTLSSLTALELPELNFERDALDAYDSALTRIEQEEAFYNAMKL